MHVISNINNFNTYNSHIDQIRNWESNSPQGNSPSIPRRIFHVATLPLQWIGQGLHAVFKAIAYVFKSIFCCFFRSKSNHITQNNSPQIAVPASIPSPTIVIPPLDNAQQTNVTSNQLATAKKIATQTAYLIGQGALVACKAAYWISKTALGGLYSAGKYLVSSSPVENFTHGTQNPSGPNGKYTSGDLVKVWQHTNTILTNGGYINSKGQKINVIGPTLQAAANTKINGKTIKSSDDFIPYPTRNYDTQISICNRDAIDVAAELAKKGYNPALLNPANARSVGGGYTRGANAMEENIFYRSGLSFCLDSLHGHQKTNFYPFEDLNQIIYTPNVPVFRYGQEHQYALMDQPRNVSILTSAAVDLNKKHRSTDIAYQKFLDETKVKIYKKLLVAANHGHDAVVLTAFGCGAFNNPPEVIAAIYQEVIQEYFKGVFKLIGFAIIDDHNAIKPHSPKGNFHPFKKMVLRMGGTEVK